MSTTCFLLKRLTAAVLPISFVWLFVACVSLCAREGAEGHSNNLVSAPMEIREASDCTGCPLTSFPKATVPQRTMHGSDLQTQIVFQSWISPLDVLAERIGFVSRQRERASTDHPLKRLPALRI